MEHSDKRYKKNPMRFDKEGFFLSFGIGTGSIAFGAFLSWAILTAPEGASRSTGYTIAQRLARTLPQSIQQKIALVFCVLCMLFGVLMVLLSMKVVIMFVLEAMAEKWKKFKHE